MFQSTILPPAGTTRPRGKYQRIGIDNAAVARRRKIGGTVGAVVAQLNAAFMTLGAALGSSIWNSTLTGPTPMAAGLPSPIVPVPAGVMKNPISRTNAFFPPEGARSSQQALAMLMFVVLRASDEIAMLFVQYAPDIAGDRSRDVEQNERRAHGDD